jgi:hypothetical protein
MWRCRPCRRCTCRCRGCVGDWGCSNMPLRITTHYNALPPYTAAHCQLLIAKKTRTAQSRPRQVAPSSAAARCSLLAALELSTEIGDRWSEAGAGDKRKRGAGRRRRARRARFGAMWWYWTVLVIGDLTPTAHSSQLTALSSQLITPQHATNN